MCSAPSRPLFPHDYRGRSPPLLLRWTMSTQMPIGFRLKFAACCACLPPIFKPVSLRILRTLADASKRSPKSSKRAMLPPSISLTCSGTAARTAALSRIWILMLPCLAEWPRQCKHKPTCTFVQPLMIPTMFLSLFFFYLLTCTASIFHSPVLHILLNSSYDVASRRFYGHSVQDSCLVDFYCIPRRDGVHQRESNPYPRFPLKLRLHLVQILS